MELLRYMKKTNTRKSNQLKSHNKLPVGVVKNFVAPADGKHSFLFWLVLPIILVWFSVSYITGMVGDKPFWAQGDRKNDEAIQTVQYYKDYGTFAENLDQPFVSFWFDDGWLSQYQLGYQILQGNGFPGTIAVAVNAVEQPGYMNWAQFRTVQKNGWETTNHSLEHNCEMQKWNREKIAYEYKTSRFIMWKNGIASDIFVSPCGVDSKVMREEAAKLFIGYRTVNPGYNDPKTVDFYDLKVQNIDDKTTVAHMKSLVDYAKANKLWVILVFHKIGDASGNKTEDEFNTPTKDFTEIVKYVKQSGIKVVTPAQILASH